MITHKIIRTKEKHKWTPTVVATADVIREESAVTSPVTDVVRAPVLPFNPTAKDYEKYLLDCPLKRGDYVTHKYTLNVENVHQLHVITGIQGFITHVKKWFNGHPSCFIVMQLYGATTKPWIRYEDAPSYRKLTEQEYTRWIVADRDHIRNHIKEHQHSIPE